jgi:hypothetical protein
VAVAANENGEPGPAVPVLTFDGSKSKSLSTSSFPIRFRTRLVGDSM